MTTEEAIQQKLAEGVELLNKMLILRVQALYVGTRPLADNPRIAAIVEEEHAKMQQWHAEIVVQLEAALLRAADRLN